MSAKRWVLDRSWPSPREWLTSGCQRSGVSSGWRLCGQWGEGAGSAAKAVETAKRTRKARLSHRTATGCSSYLGSLTIRRYKATVADRLNIIQRSCGHQPITALHRRGPGREEKQGISRRSHGRFCPPAAGQGCCNPLSENSPSNGDRRQCRYLVASPGLNLVNLLPFSERPPIGPLPP
jgi:hypothetical protein